MFCYSNVLPQDGTWPNWTSLQCQSTENELKLGAPGYDPNGQKAEEGGWRTQGQPRIHKALSQTNKRDKLIPTKTTMLRNDDVFAGSLDNGGSYVRGRKCKS